MEGCDYSFSGLKTAVRALVEKELPTVKANSMPEASATFTRPREPRPSCKVFARISPLRAQLRAMS